MKKTKEDHALQPYGYLGAVHKLRQVFFEDFRPPLPPLSDEVRFGGPPLNNDVIFEYLPAPLPSFDSNVVC